MTKCVNIFTVRDKPQYRYFLHKNKRCVVCWLYFKVGDRVRRRNTSPNYYHVSCFEKVSI